MNKSNSFRSAYEVFLTKLAAYKIPIKDNDINHADKSYLRNHKL